LLLLIANRELLLSATERDIIAAARVERQQNNNITTTQGDVKTADNEMKSVHRLALLLLLFVYFTTSLALADPGTPHLQRRVD